jgi:hypothetical protein
MVHARFRFGRGRAIKCKTHTGLDKLIAGPPVTISREESEKLAWRYNGLGQEEKTDPDYQPITQQGKDSTDHGGD